MKKFKYYTIVFILVLFALNKLSGQTVHKTSFYSQALERNNNVHVYLPPNYDINVNISYSVIYYLHGWNGNEKSVGTIIDMADSLITYNLIDPLIIVCANNSPSPFLGSNYVNSELNGDYEDYMTVDLVRWIEANYRTIPNRKNRSLMGQSMGGAGCFRYGVLHKDLYCGFAAHGSPIIFDLLIDDVIIELKSENGTGPPYFYSFSNGLFTQLIFGKSGAYCPNPSSPQDYIDPQIVEFPIDDQGDLIDSIYQKFAAFDPVNYIHNLTPTDSVAILFSAGRNDDLHLFPSNFAMKDTLDSLGLEYEFYDHTGGHGMPVPFRSRALVFLDSIMPGPLNNQSCVDPSNQNVTFVTTNSASLDWTENGSASQWQVRLGQAPFDTLGVVPVFVSNDTLILDTLQASTSYEWYVRADCGEGDSSLWVGPASFNTACGIPDSLLAYDITDTLATLKWKETGIASQWQIRLGQLPFDTLGVEPIAVFNDTILIDSLMPSTSYEWYVRAYCGEGDSSVWVGPASFETDIITCKAPYLLYDADNTSIQINWQLFGLSGCTLEWGTDESYGSSVETTEFGDDHQHQYVFTGLDLDTKYYYRLTIGNEIFTGNFKTSPPDTVTEFTVFAYGDTRTYPANHDNVAAKILEDIQNNPTSQTFILSSGDLVANGDNETDWDEQFFDPEYSNIQELLRSLPYMAGMGNHEKSGALFDKYFPYSFYTNNRFYGSFDYANVHFIIVDQYTDYTVGSQQYNWLENDLSTTDKLWKIILLHEPGWSAGHHPNNTDVQTIIQPLCETYQVQFVIAGHNHYYARAHVNNVIHITTGGGGAPLYDPDENYDSVVTVDKSFHYCKFHFDNNLCVLTAINKDGDTIDSFSKQILTCFEPSGLLAYDITNTLASLTWKETGVALQWQIRLDTLGFDTTGMTPVMLAKDTITVDTLLSNTSYDWYVRSVCDDGSNSDWAGPHTFTTSPCVTTPAVLPFYEGFEARNKTLKYEGTFCSPTYSFTYENNNLGFGRARLGNHAVIINSGNGAVTLDRDPEGSATVNYVTLAINLSDYENADKLYMSFAYASHNDESDPNDKVWIRGNDNDSWIEIFDLDPGGLTDSEYHEVNDLELIGALNAASPSQSPGSTFQIRFGQEGTRPSPSDGISFDDVLVATIPNSRTVENITIIDGQTECYDATSTITVAGSGTTVDILSGGEATFIAGERIRWKPGFHAHEGSYGHGYITETGEYCDEQQPMVAVQTPAEEEADIIPELFVDEDVGVKIYPNPTLGKFTIDFIGKTTAADIILMDFKGNRVLEIRCEDQNKKVIDIGHVPGGMYIIVIKTQSQIITKKIIKNY